MIKENCIKKDCIKRINRPLQDILIAPFEEGTPEIRKLFAYYLQDAPNIESAHSMKIHRSLHADIFDRMLEGRHFKHQKFCGSNATIENELEKGFLNGNNICLKCKRFVCKKKKTDKGKEQETDLDCFLRHIRNAIAHGRVYYCHAGNRIHVIFEDKNSSGKLSARIVCIKADLDHWKRVLSDKRYYT